jgi:HK97 family phage portal protein
MFLSRIRASSDDRAPYGDFWYEPVGMRSASGARVTSDSALKLSVVYACIKRRADAMASLPVHVFRKRAKSGNKEFLRDHWLHRLFNRAPNTIQDPFHWMELVQGTQDLRGNAYNRIKANARGEITGLVPVHPDRVSTEVIGEDLVRYRIKGLDGAPDEVVPAEMMFRVLNMSSDGYTGLSPVALAREAIGAGLAQQDYAGRFFANDARPGGIIQWDKNFKDKAAADLFRASWHAAQGGVNRGKTAILPDGMTYKEVGLNNRDSQFIEARKFTVVDLCRIWNMPPHMIGDLDRATFANIEQMSLEFAMYTIAPECQRWKCAVEFQLLGPDEDEIEIEFDWTALVRGDQSARGNFYAKGIAAGWLTRNEARVDDNRDPIAGLDEPLRPLNMVEESDAEEVEGEGGEVADDDQAQPPAKAPAPPGEDTQPEPGANQRLRALAAAAAERVARKEVELVIRALGDADPPQALEVSLKKHATFVASCLGIDAAQASRYCEGQQVLIDSFAYGGQPSIDINHPNFRAWYERAATSRLTRLALKGTS